MAANLDHSDSVPESFFFKVNLKKVSKQENNHEKLASMERIEDVDSIILGRTCFDNFRIL